ncbi:MAG: GntR family transcriptional regulator [Lachnospiraceae bacterium]|nr:GntR family transcriptional regulator [Lachnospiraceae bacterium]
MKISQESGIPIYQQIATQLRSDILEQRIPSGEYLPSIRGLAKELRISVITTMKAYEILEKEGLVVAVQGKGFLVRQQDAEMVKEQYRRKVEGHLQEALAAAKMARMSMDEVIMTLKILDVEGE